MNKSALIPGSPQKVSELPASLLQTLLESAQTAADRTPPMDVMNQEFGPAGEIVDVKNAVAYCTENTLFFH